MTTMSDAKPGDTTVIFQCLPDSEYGWVTDPEWFDDIDEPVTIIRQHWRLTEEGKVTFHPRTELCLTCNGEGEVQWDHQAGPQIETCSMCKGDGVHPLAGQMEVH